MKHYKLLKDTPTIKAGTIFEEVTSDFDEWFEEIEEPTDSIHWKPNNGDEYWYTDDCGGIYRDRWDDESIHVWRYLLGLIKRTKEECEQARERELAKVRLQRTSTFKPDFENGNGGWFVGYKHLSNRLKCYESPWQDCGQFVRYETKEEAEKSIKENERDWKIYFGIKEEE